MQLQSCPATAPGSCQRPGLPHMRGHLSARRAVVQQGLGTEAVQRLLDEGTWLLDSPAVPVSTVETQGGAAFSVVRDDLMPNPLLGGNKGRKLDGLWPQLRGCTDVVTCGGLQSAHTVAVAAACADHGIAAHLLVRGERPAVPTGHHLYARLLGHVTYVPRSEYADRQGMLDRYVQQLQASPSPSGPSGRQRHIGVVPEGAGDPRALLGLVRLVRWLAQQSPLAGRRCKLVVDSGTGTTAIGLALGAALLGAPWEVLGITLAAPLSYYQQQQAQLLEAFCQQQAQALGQSPAAAAALQQRAGEVLGWAPRAAPRKFGQVLPGEVERCREVAQRHGILLDPIWSLAAWEAAEALALAEAAQQQQQLQVRGAQLQDAAQQQQQQGTDAEDASKQQQTTQGQPLVAGLPPGAAADWEVQPAAEEAAHVVMLHTGGMLGICGLAQRYPDAF